MKLPRIPRRGMAAMLVAALVGGVCGVPAAQAGEGFWSTAAGIQARFGLAAAGAADGHIFALGGDSGSSTLDVAQVYTPATRTWTALPPMSHARFGAAAAAVGDTVYVLGGSDADTMYKDVERISGADGTWSTVTPMSSFRYALGAAADDQGRIYAVGGNDRNDAVKTVERYTPATDSWAAVGSMSVQREWPAVTAGLDGRIYAFGGSGGPGAEYLASAEVYDPAANAWTPIAPMPTARFGASAATVPGGRIVVTGGIGSDGSFLATAEAYNPSTNTWSTVTDVPRVRAYGASVTAGDGRVFDMGGMGAGPALGAVDALQLVDTVPPSLTSVSIENGAEAVPGNDVSVTLVASGTPGDPVAIRATSKAPICNPAPCKLDPGYTKTMPYTPTFSWDLSDPAFGGVAADGTKTVRVQVVDAAGNVSVIRSDAVLIDTSIPQITAGPSTRFYAGSALAAGRAPVQALWSGADTPGVARYSAEWQQAGGAFAALPLSGPTATNRIASYPRGCSCVVRVNAQDAAGNTSPWAQSAPFTPAVVQEGGSGVGRSGTWTLGTSSGFDGGHTRYSTRAGATLRFSFTGRSVAWVAPKGPTRGQARIYIDGVLTSTVSLQSSSPQLKRLVYARNWPSAGTHTIAVRVVGTAGHPRVDVDAFVTLN